MRMSEDRLPKQLFYSELSEGHRLRGRPMLCFKDTLKKSLQNFSIDTAHWETTALNRCVWRQCIRKGAAAYEQAKWRAHTEKHAATKARSQSSGSPIQCHVLNSFCCFKQSHIICTPYMYIRGCPILPIQVGNIEHLLYTHTHTHPHTHTHKQMLSSNV